MYNQFRNKNKNSGYKSKKYSNFDLTSAMELENRYCALQLENPMSENMPFTFYLHQSAFRFIVVYVWQCFYDQFKILSLSLE